MKKNISITTIIFITIINFILIPIPSFAQTNADFTLSFLVNDKSAVDGDILVSTNQSLSRANSVASTKLFGILQTNPVIVLRSSDANTKPVATGGIALVNVTTIGGPIKTGDYITSSVIPGKGEKLADSGYAIGIAQADFNGVGADTITANGQQVASGKIPVSIKVDYVDITNPRNISRFTSALSSAILNNIQNPNQFFQAIRYIAAGLIMLGSFLLGFFTFSRAIPKGVEAIGRNPLAKNSIYISIVLNIIFTLLITAVGLIASVIILRL